MMADSDAAAALQLHTRMDVILWNLGPRQRKGKEKTRPERRKMIKRLAEHIDEEASGKYSRPYVLTCDDTGNVGVRVIKENCETTTLIGTKSQRAHLHMWQFGGHPENATIENDTLKCVLEKCKFPMKEKPDVTRLSAALVNQGRVLVVSWWGEHKTKENADQSSGPLSIQEKCAKLKYVIDFVERLRVHCKADAVLMGGDFNLEPKYAREILDNDEQLHGKVFDSYVLPSHRPKMIDYVVVWPKGRFSCVEARELTEKDHGIPLQESLNILERSTMHNDFDHGVIYYKIYFLNLKIDEEMGNCLSEVDRRSVRTVVQDLNQKFSQSVHKVQDTRKTLFQHANGMLNLEEKLELRDEPRLSFAHDVVELYRFVAKRTTCFPWMVLSTGSMEHYLQQLAETSSEIKQGNPTKADANVESGIFQKAGNVMEAAVSIRYDSFASKSFDEAPC